MPKRPRHPAPRKAVSLVAGVVLLSASLASAAPAVVTTNTPVRSAPFAVAPPVGTLLSGDRVNADDAPTNGWRRVELPGGKFGYVPDETVKVDLSAVKPAPKVAPPRPAAAAAPTPEAPAEGFAALPPASEPVRPVAAGTPGARTPIYVGDFSHLASLVKSDPQVFDLADGIASRSTASSVAIWGGVFGGLALRILAATALANESCFALISGGKSCTKVENVTLSNFGTAIIILGPLIGWAIRPTRDDKTDVINAWNAKHPDRPFIDRAGIEAP